MDFVNNAFSLQMLQKDCNLKIKHISKKEFNKAKQKAVSVVGHEETARILKLKYNRTDITLCPGDTLYVAQLVGGRLPEGCTKLPAGYTFKYLKVEVM